MKHYLLFLVLSCFLTANTNSQDQSFDNEGLQHIRDTNLVLAQYYRWFLLFERPQNSKRITNHLEILHENVKIKTYSGSMNGHSGMEDFIKDVGHWRNSHHILDPQVTRNQDGILILEADIVYQNIINQDQRNNYRLHYSAKLEPNKNNLPIFTQLELLPTAVLGAQDFKDAYLINKSKAFVHFWLSILDGSLESSFLNRVIDPINFKQYWSGEQVNHSPVPNSENTTTAYKTFNIEVTDDNQSIVITAQVHKINLEKIQPFKFKWVVTNELDNPLFSALSLSIEEL